MDSPSDSWSPAFIRTRTELFLTATTIMVLTSLDLNLNKIPLLGIELAHPAPREKLLQFLWVFYVYFFISWLTKAYLERSGGAFSASKISEYSASLKSVDEKIGNIYDADLEQKMPDLLAAWDGKMNEYRQSVQNLNTGIRQNLRSLAAARGPLDNREPLNEKERAQLSEADDKQALATVTTLFENLNAAGREHLDKRKAEFIVAIDNRSTSVGKEVEAARELISATRAEMDAFGKALTLDKWITGFLAPLMYAIGAPLWAVYQTW